MIEILKIIWLFASKQASSPQSFDVHPRHSIPTALGNGVPNLLSIDNTVFPSHIFVSQLNWGRGLDDVDYSTFSIKHELTRLECTVIWILNGKITPFLISFEIRSTGNMIWFSRAYKRLVCEFHLNLTVYASSHQRARNIYDLFTRPI